MGNKGFTLIEILIVITISGMILGFAATSYRDFQGGQEIEQAGLALKTNLRFAQSQAFGGVKESGCTGTLIGWYVQLLSNRYEVRSRCLTSSPVNANKTVILPQGATMSFSAGPVVLFQPINQSAAFISSPGDDPDSSPTQTSVTVSKESRNFTLTINRTGDINEGGTPIPTGGVPTVTPTTSVPTPTRTPTPTISVPTPTRTPTPTSSGHPSAPTNLTATTVDGDNTRIDLNWTTVSDATGYKRYRCAGFGCTNFTFVGQSDLPPFVDWTADCGTTYSYRITATNSFGESGFSNTATATTAACGPDQSGPPVCSSISGPDNIAVSQKGTFTFNYSGMVHMVQYGTTGPAVPSAGYIYAPNKTIDIGWSSAGTYQVNGFAYNANTFQQSNCPARTVVVGTATSPTPTPSVLYVDNDGDGYGAGFPVSSCPFAKTCVSNNQDCYDADPASTNAELAFPGQTQYFTTNRGDGSFDYDCSGTKTINPAENCDISGNDNECIDSERVSGYNFGPPDCGVSGSWGNRQECSSTCPSTCTGRISSGCTDQLTSVSMIVRWTTKVLSCK